MIREYIIKISDEVFEDECAGNPPELVRCKDCKYAAPDMFCGHPNDGLNPEAFNDGNPDFFCAHGERNND